MSLSPPHECFKVHVVSQVTFTLRQGSKAVYDITQRVDCFPSKTTPG